jgi:excisionase family DNA binding protein
MKQMTTDEVTHYLRISVGTLYQYAREGKLHGVKIGGQGNPNVYDWAEVKRVYDYRHYWDDLRV